MGLGVVRGWGGQNGAQVSALMRRRYKDSSESVGRPPHVHSFRRPPDGLAACRIGQNDTPVVIE